MRVSTRSHIAENRHGARAQHDKDQETKVNLIVGVAEICRAGNVGAFSEEDVTLFE